ncbi:FAD-dependent oxidoreductase [Nonomuraea zeae]|uniref:Kynurenine 3-monooxygenase n=1 Tax=Nonomuraea zeae TaxID=1642303 RepID=A0A5S4F7Y9_9ACTN|nr:NAD(P)/FAD-dependent oxidoreductase [Nonomuraea zeae]TMR12526.1 FAD-dependent monooxygenase [Nonomuraea zeae]
MEVTIVGAGLVGCLLACFLARRGHRVVLYERRHDPRERGADRGRSINLAISERGIDALRRLGLDGRVLDAALPMAGRMMHSPGGALAFQPYSADRAQAINSISRAELNRELLTAATALHGVEVRFGHRLTGVDERAGRLAFESTAPDGTSGAVTVDKAQVVIGADGAYSAVRARLQQLPGMNFSQDYLDYGYKELSIPARHGEFAMDPGALHIWPRGRSMMIALPNPDRSFTCTLFWPHDTLAALDTPGKIRAYFAEHYQDAFELMPDLVGAFQGNPVGQLVTVRCSPWHVTTEATTIGLVGDAAHAIVPFYGQGANCGFEDCVELDRYLDEAGDDFPRALELFERRKTDTDVIARLALENFVEMRDRVGSRMFLAGKRVEHALERVLPGYVSRYELISFSTTPYAEVERRGVRQRRWAAAGVGAALLAALGYAARRTGLVRTRDGG